MLMRRDHLLEWVKPVRQARSRETLERLLDAAEALILERGVEAASVSAVVKRARSSVGAFYARFPDKDSLLRAVCERFVEQALATIEVALHPARWEDESLEEVLSTAMRFALRMAHEKRALLACLVTAGTRDLVLAKALDSISLHLGERLHWLLSQRGELPPAPRPELVTHMLSATILAFVQVGALRHVQHAALYDQALVAEELARLGLAYLTAPTPQRPVRNTDELRGA
jgi:AcrR family transcriptional regulator